MLTMDGSRPMVCKNAKNQKAVENSIDLFLPINNCVEKLDP